MDLAVLCTAEASGANVVWQSPMSQKWQVAHSFCSCKTKNRFLTRQHKSLDMGFWQGCNSRTDRVSDHSGMIILPPLVCWMPCFIFIYSFFLHWLLLMLTLLLLGEVKACSVASLGQQVSRLAGWVACQSCLTSYPSVTFFLPERYCQTEFKGQHLIGKYRILL